MDCRQKLYILFSRPQSSLNCRMRHLHGGESLAADRDHLEAFLRWSTALGFRPATAPTLGTVCSEADDKLITAIALNPFHLLHHLLPPRRDTHYSLRPMHTTSLSQFELRHSETIISLTECYIKTLFAFDNIVVYVFHFNLTAILCISVLTVTFIKLLLTYLVQG